MIGQIQFIGSFARSQYLFPNHKSLHQNTPLAAVGIFPREGRVLYFRLKSHSTTLIIPDNKSVIALVNASCGE